MWNLGNMGQTRRLLLLAPPWWGFLPRWRYWDREQILTQEVLEIVHKNTARKWPEAKWKQDSYMRWWSHHVWGMKRYRERRWKDFFKHFVECMDSLPAMMDRAMRNELIFGSELSPHIFSYYTQWVLFISKTMKWSFFFLQILLRVFTS